MLSTVSSGSLLCYVCRPQILTCRNGHLAGKALKEDESPTYVETWKEMEKLFDTGKVRSIGVSNFSIKTLEVLLP